MFNSSRPEPREPGRPEPRTPAQKAVEPAKESAPAKPVEAQKPAGPAAVNAPVAAAPAAVPQATRESHRLEPRTEVTRASVLGPTLKFRGELSAQEDLIVQGSIEGSITHTQNLTIGTDGSMRGDIRARVIVIDGKVDGDLYATESVTIRTTARVKGNVFAPRVAISDGAFFQGQIDMQPSGAAVQEQSARLRQAALAAPGTSASTAASPALQATGSPAGTATLEGAAMDSMLSNGTGF